MTPELFYLIFAFILLMAMLGTAYHVGRGRGAASERIKLYGNTLPDFKHTPPPPPKEKGVPTMPNHPPMPQINGQAVYFAQDFLKEHPSATTTQAYVHGFSLATRLALAAVRINKAKEGIEKITEDLLSKVDQSYRDQYGRDPLPQSMRPPANDQFEDAIKHRSVGNYETNGKIEARGIKFLIWDREAATWYKPTFQAYEGRLHELLITTEGEICQRGMDGFTHESKFPNRYVVLRYTGLKDQKGKEVYEGDIVRDRFGRVMEVKWFNYRLCWVAISDTNFHHADLFDWVERDEEGDLNDTARVEVIGNRYETPELFHITPKAKQ